MQSYTDITRLPTQEFVAMILHMFLDHPECSHTRRSIRSPR